MAISEDELMAAIPRGIILPWNGAGAVPRGWALCDGTQGTPDLTGKFLRGGAAGNVGETGGSATHVHVVTKDGGRDGRGFEVNGECGLGAADERNHLPPFYTVQYIMKV